VNFLLSGEKFWPQQLEEVLVPFFMPQPHVAVHLQKGGGMGLEWGGNRVGIGRQSYVRNYAIFAWYLRLVCSFVRLSAARCVFNCIKEGFRSVPGHPGHPGLVSFLIGHL